MADDKQGREDQARAADRRQRQRDVAAELERMDETEPPVPETELNDLERELGALSFPVTGAEVVETIGDRPIESADGDYTVADLVPETETEQFDAPEAVRVRVARPTVAAAMKRIVEASEGLQNTDLKRSQREAYERTFRELVAIDAVDEDEGIDVMADWIVERIREKGKLPGSRDVRREAAKYCRKHGYEIRNDEWLGV
ncbi:DUF5789 family protein [Halorientalis marina]|jgi:hypothetical protein|uniref:DUF5789 family protein n=1 Tax=Halorientalis marina TaxID=2931976 RepID=UPI001FF4C192|nr:hypothetical protein [Halorientalis marina]